MNALFDEALDIVGQLSSPAQEKLAAQMLDAALRALIDEKVAAGDADIAAGRVKPADEVFERLISKYDLQSTVD